MSDQQKELTVEETLKQIYPHGLWQPIEEQDKWVEETDKVLAIFSQELSSLEQRKDQEWRTKVLEIIGIDEGWADFVEPYSTTKNTHDQEMLKHAKETELTCRYKLRAEQRQRFDTLLTHKDKENT